MGKPLWEIDGFVTAAGTPIVQKWFWGDTSLEERDALRDRMNYLAYVEKNLWAEPYFKWFGDIGEVRNRVSTGALRVYGYFLNAHYTFVFLEGTVKKKTKDREGVEVARTRLKRLKNGEGSTYGFDFSERPSGEDSPGQEGEGATDRVEPEPGDCFSD